MKVHYLQHVPFEGPGYIHTWLIENGHEISSTRFFEAIYHIPDPESIDALIIMGGPMSVHDEIQYPWLVEEKKFINKCQALNKKILGICLGAQLIADCLSSAVKPAENKEIGWFKVRPTEACSSVMWFHELFKDEPAVFHWHGEKFDIPQGSINLLSTEANDNQAFLHGGNILGLQFHIEVERMNILQMLESCWSELDKEPYIQGLATIVMGIQCCIKTRRIMKNLLDNFLV